MHHDAQMRTTIDINDAILKELRTRARLEKRPLRRVLEDVLQRGLSAEGVSRAVRVETFPIGIKPAYRGMSLNQLYDQLESEDHLKVAES